MHHIYRISLVMLSGLLIHGHPAQSADKLQDVDFAKFGGITNRLTFKDPDTASEGIDRLKSEEAYKARREFKRTHGYEKPVRSNQIYLMHTDATSVISGDLKHKGYQHTGGGAIGARLVDTRQHSDRLEPTKYVDSQDTSSDDGALLGEKKELERKILELKNILRDLMRKLKAIQFDQNRISRMIASTSAEMIRLEEKLKKLEQDDASLNDERTSIENQIGQTNDDITKIEEKLNKIQSSLDANAPTRKHAEAVKKIQDHFNQMARRGSNVRSDFADRFDTKYEPQPHHTSPSREWTFRDGDQGGARYGRKDGFATGSATETVEGTRNR